MRANALLLLLLLASPDLAAWGGCEHTAERRAMIDTAGIKTLALRAGAGELTVVGEPGRTRIEAIGKACAGSAEQLGKIQLLASRDRDRALLDTVLPESGWGDDYASLDLTVRVPAWIALDGQDSSGEARIGSVAAVDFIDSSGELRIEDITGPVAVTDSSGEIEIVSSTGPVTVRNDSSGSIVIRRIATDVEVRTDSSGEIDIREVTGSAQVGRDTSGGIEFADIGGDAVVGSDSSGSISAERIGGDFRVDADGSGSIDHRDVIGAVRIPQD